MSKDNKNISSSENDGLSELFDAFGGIREDESEDLDARSDLRPAEQNHDVLEARETDELDADEIALVLPEISYDEDIDEDLYEDITDDLNIAAESDDNADAKEDASSADHTESEKKDEKPSDKESHKKNKKEKKHKKTEVKEKNAKNENRHEKKRDEKHTVIEEMIDESKPTSPAKIIIVLTAICAAVALLLATVNHYTESKIAENTEKAMLSSIREIFDEGVKAEAIIIPEGSELTSAYLVIKNDGVCGYAASVSPAGFGGPLNLMVGVDSEGAVVGVEIVAMAETPGLGSKIGGADFLSRFTGMRGEVTVDVISGASISSKAVIAGVNSVTGKLLDIASLAAEKNLPVVPYVSDTTAPVTTVPATEEPILTEDDLTATVAPVTEAPAVIPEVTKADAPPEVIVPNPNNEYNGIYPEHTEDTAEYETMTTEPESGVSDTSVPETAGTDVTGDAVPADPAE